MWMMMMRILHWMMMTSDEENLGLDDVWMMMIRILLWMMCG
jgi:hypothetical protein